MKPGYVPDFPAQRIDDEQLRSYQLLFIQTGGQFQSPFMGIRHDFPQIMAI